MSVSYYTQQIQDACAVDAQEAAVIEEVMRTVSSPTLDHLTAQELASVARQGQIVLALLREEDPAIAAWYEKCAA